MIKKVTPTNQAIFLTKKEPKQQIKGKDFEEVLAEAMERQRRINEKFERRVKSEEGNGQAYR